MEKKKKQVKERNMIALQLNMIGKPRTQVHKSKKSYSRKRKHKNKSYE